MTVAVEVPDSSGVTTLRLEHLLLDLNGTLTDRGVLLPEVAGRVQALRRLLEVHVLTADTYHTAAGVSAAIGVERVEIVGDGADKAAVVDRLGAFACAAIGNGANDEAMLRAAGLGIAVLGPEGASPRTLLAAAIVCPSIIHALDLLRDPLALTATLRR